MGLFQSKQPAVVTETVRTDQDSTPTYQDSTPAAQKSSSSEEAKTEAPPCENAPAASEVTFHSDATSSSQESKLNVATTQIVERISSSIAASESLAESLPVAQAVQPSAGHREVGEPSQNAETLPVPDDSAVTTQTFEQNQVTEAETKPVLSSSTESANDKGVDLDPVLYQAAELSSEQTSETESISDEILSEEVELVVSSPVGDTSTQVNATFSTKPNNLQTEVEQEASYLINQVPEFQNHANEAAEQADIQTHQSPESVPAEIADNKKSAVVITWEHEGSDVHVTGTFCDWKDNIPLEKSGETFSVTVNLNPGQHYIKFLVDGTWTVNKNLEITDLDGQGEVNVITVEDHHSEE